MLYRLPTRRDLADRSSRSRRTRHVLVPCLLSATIAFAAISPAQADPKRGSTGKVSGPSLPAASRSSSNASTKPSTARPSSKASPKTSSSKSSSSKTSSGGLGSGSKGSAVVELQTLLQAAHYDIPEATGTYGDQTFHAVMAFQKANGLPRTGRATSQTIAALRSGVTPDPIMPDGGPDRVEVSIPKQYLALYRGGSLIRILSVSTGSGKDFCTLDPETGETGCDVAVTPPGSFRVGRRVIGWRESKLGLLYNPLYFNGGIALHGAPSVPGTPASHGCVRVPMVSADYLPTVVPDGIPVYVSDGVKTLKPITSKIAAADSWVGEQNAVLPTTTTIPGATTTTVLGATTTKAGGSTTTTSAPTASGATTTTAVPGSPTTTGLVQTTLARSLTTTTTVSTTTTTVAPTTSTTRPL